MRKRKKPRLHRQWICLPKLERLATTATPPPEITLVAGVAVVVPATDEAASAVAEVRKDVEAVGVGMLVVTVAPPNVVVRTSVTVICFVCVGVAGLIVVDIVGVGGPVVVLFI